MELSTSIDGDEYALALENRQRKALNFSGSKERSRIVEFAPWLSVIVDRINIVLVLLWYRRIGGEAPTVYRVAVVQLGLIRVRVAVAVDVGDVSASAGETESNEINRTSALCRRSTHSDPRPFFDQLPGYGYVACDECGFGKL